MNGLYKAVRGKNRSRKGFTITELLFVVALLAVLFGLVALSLVNMQKELRQKELDSKAEIIYTAAQNRITELKAQGLKAKYESGGTNLGFIPLDADKTVSPSADDFFFTADTAKTDENAPAYWLLPAESIDSELYSGNWVIEYNVNSGFVYAVFYSEAPIHKTPKELDYLRAKDARLADGAKIGYYGGEIAVVQTTREFEIRKLNIINEETLYADITVASPVSDDFKLMYWLEDANGNKTAEKELTMKTFIGGGEYTAKLSLDSLVNDAARFKNLFPELDAGADFTLHVYAHIPGNLLIKRGSREETANSLFANHDETNSEADTAYIKFGRHLQNLDEGSGVYEEITKAVQLNDILFAENGERENTGKLWLDVYGEKKLTAIYNEKLLSYKGVLSEEEIAPTVYGAKIAANTKNGSTGIFAAAADGMEISDLRLSGITASAGKNTGALIGESNGKVTVKNCAVLLSAEKGDLEGKYQTDVSKLENRIFGTEAAGGIVGKATSTGNGGLTIEKSFAATVIGGGTRSNVGGLVGKAEGVLTVTESYASCYVSGYTAGGIAGNAATLSINSSYAAGYINATGTAYGFSAGTLSFNSENSYTAVHSVSAKPYYSTCSGGSADKIYYLEDSSSESFNLNDTVRKGFSEMSGRTEFAALLGNKFTATTGGDNTTPYNLLNQGLTDYSFPKLTSLVHYGDWNAEFVTAQLVYFEEYQNGNFGFSGANKDTLRAPGPSSFVVGDGYALVFDSKPAVGEEFSFKIQTSQGGTMSAEYTVEVENENDLKEVGDEDEGETLYYLLPVKTEDFDVSNAGYEVTNSALPSAFYRKIEITNGMDNNTETYYFNPHFAKTVTGDLPANPPSTVYVRSPRQLYYMSLEYGDYAKFLDSAATYTTFRQEQALYYEEYNWTDYYPVDGNFNGGELISQMPIGGDDSPFLSIYNGSCYGISGVSFAGRGDNIGMFGINDGRIIDVVLTKHEINDKASSLTIRRNGTIIYSGTNVNMGVLCGLNRGTISNCAAANYSAAVDVNQGATLALGGLCGENRGTIIDSSAVITGYEVSALYSEIYAGGFVGINSGTVRYCYSLGSIRTKSANSTRPVRIAGFAASNTGDINYSYCATALTTSGSATSCAFNPSNEGTTAKNSFYINDGTYYFGNDLYSYKSVDDYGVIGPQEVSAAELKNKNVSIYFGKAQGGNSWDKYGVFYGTAKNYPFPAIVKDSAGNYIHYGDWVVEANLGEQGVFYWEREEGSGSNSGYHLSFIGINDGSNGDGGSVVSGTTLCQEHDDGGVVTEYGYGYYYGQNVPSLSIDGVGTPSYTRNAEAEAGLHAILSDFNFVAYTSGTPNAANSQGVLYTTGTSQNNTWRLTAGGNNGVVHVFYVSPFFADAFSYVSSGYNTVIPEDENTLESTDNYAKIPGTEANPYQVRSTKQLQYINWNNETRTVSKDVTSSNYDDFTYLQYATVRTVGIQTAAAAEARRPVRYWKQTHDIAAETDEYFYPIAGTYETSTGTANYNAYLYAWFGGQYDGASYVIKNVQISTNIFNVGLFGTTVAARLENIILYSDRNSVIERNSSASDAAGAYVLGGLVGIAYDYNTMTNREITNCAIAGYKIIDNSKNEQRLSEANVGGLAGISNVNLNKCSSVVDIEINCTHRTATGGYTSATYGNYVRVGGVAGACRSTMRDCYSGGSVTVGEETLAENILDRYGRFIWNTSTYVVIGGLGGSGFTSNFVNFNGSSSLIEGYPSYTNCYTYMKFPKLEGTIRAITLIGGVADRYNASRATITNCYYLDICANIDVDMTSTLRSSLSDSTRSLPDIFRADSSAMTEMLLGNMRCMEINISGTNRMTTLSKNGITPLTYEQMSERLSPLTGANAIDQQNPARNTNYTSFTEALGGGNASSFGWVTVEENGAAVNGKYSFAGSDLALEGKNYPFPTVITQESLVDGKTVNVHYGAWAKVGLFWSESMNYIDIFRDYDYDEKETAKELELSFEGLDVQNPEPGDFTFEIYKDNQSYLDGTPETYATPTDAPVSPEIEVKDDNGDDKFEVSLKARNPGACYVRAIFDNGTTRYTADSYVSVTADFTVTAEPSFAGIYIGDDQNIVFNVMTSDKNGDPVNLTEKELVSWEDVLNSKPDSNLVYYENKKPLLDADSEDKYNFEFKGMLEGELQLTFTANVNLPLGGETKQFSKDAYVSVTVKKPGVIGIVYAKPETAVSYNEALIPRGETTGETYYSALTDYTGKIAPNLAGNEIYLYASGTGINIDEFSVSKIEVKKADETVKTILSGNTTDFSEYYVSIEPAKVPDDGDANFEYRIMKVNAKDESLNGEVTLVVTAQYFGNTYVVESPYTVTAVKPKAIIVDEAGNVLLEKEVAFGEVPQMTDEDWDTADAAANVARIDLGYHCDRTAATEPAFAKIYTDTKYKAKLLVNSYTIKLLPGADDVTGTMEDLTVDYDEHINLTALAYERLGYKFSHWSYETSQFTDGAEVYSLTSVNGGTAELTATWSAVPNYNIVYDLNGATGTAPAQVSDVKYGQPVDLADTTAVTRTGYTLLGWNTASTATEALASPVKNLTEAGGNMSLYAVWQKNKYNVTYVYDNGTPNSVGEHEFEEVLVLPEAPTKTGYTFAGWEYDGAVYNNTDNRLSVPAGNITVTATWTINQYTVTYSDASGIYTGTASETKDYGTAITLPTQTRQNYNLFWSDGTNEYPAGSQYTIPDRDVTMNAVWREVRYSVTFDVNGGNAVTNQYTDGVTSGTRITLPTPTRTNAVFKGWDLDGTLYKGNYTVNSDVEFTAQWMFAYRYSYYGNTALSISVRSNGNYRITHNIGNNGYTVRYGGRYGNPVTTANKQGNYVDISPANFTDDIYIVRNN